MICSCCYKPIRATKTVNYRGKGLARQFQCYHCTAWLGRNPLLGRLKLAGFYLGVAALIYGWLVPSVRYFIIPLTILAFIMMVVSHLMDQLQVVEAPPQIDDSEQRQKYR